MGPSFWIAFLMIALVVLAGATEIYAQRRRRGLLREQFKQEYCGSTRHADRLRRAEYALAARRQRFEHEQLGHPVPVAIPVLIDDRRRMPQPDERLEAD